MRIVMMSLLVGISQFGLAGCGSDSSNSSATDVRMLTPEELSEMQSAQNSVQVEEQAHFAELRKGSRPSR